MHRKPGQLLQSKEIWESDLQHYSYSRYQKKLVAADIIKWKAGRG